MLTLDHGQENKHKNGEYDDICVRNHAPLGYKLDTMKNVSCCFKVNFLYYYMLILFNYLNTAVLIVTSHVMSYLVYTNGSSLMCRTPSGWN